MAKRFKIVAHFIVQVENESLWSPQECALSALEHIINEGYHPQALLDWSVVTVSPTSRKTLSDATG